PRVAKNCLPWSVSCFSLEVSLPWFLGHASVEQNRATTRLLRGECSRWGCFPNRDSHPFDGLSSAVEHQICSPFAIQSTRGLNERCAHESGPHCDCANHADCAGHHPDRCVSDPRGDGISSVSAGQEGRLDGSLCA